MLQERRLLGIFGTFVAHVCPNSEAVDDVGVECDLVRDGHILKKVFGFASLGGREDLIRLWDIGLVRYCDCSWSDRQYTSSRDGERGNHSLDLFSINKTRVSHGGNIDALAGGGEASDVLGPEAVADGADLLDAHVGLHLLDDGLDDGVDLLEGVAIAGAAGGQPFHNVEAFWAIKGDGVALEEIGHNDKVAIGGEVVGDAGGSRSVAGRISMSEADRTAGH